MSLKGVVYNSTFTARCWTNFGIRSCMKCKSYFSKWKITEYVWRSLRIYIAHKMSSRSESSQTFKASSSLSAPWSMLLSTPNQSSPAEPPDGPASAPLWTILQGWETLLIGMSPCSPSTNLSQLIPLLEWALPSAKPSYIVRGWSWVIQKKGVSIWSNPVWVCGGFPMDIGTSPLWRSILVTLLVVL